MFSMNGLLMAKSAPSVAFIRELYARMMLARIVDEYAWSLHQQGYIHFVARSCGHEAAQVGSAICIERGTDFTLPYYRDLGVALTLGMTPYEVFRSYLQAVRSGESTRANCEQGMPNWGYHKYNTVMGPAPVATQIMHASGIAFASKLRKAPVVTVAYCGDGATTEADFQEGLRFAAQHQLPVVFICEQTYQQPSLTVPEGIVHRDVDGANVVAVYSAMQEAMQCAREGHGPTLLEMHIVRLSSSSSELDEQPAKEPAKDADRSPSDNAWSDDPLLYCRSLLQQMGGWDDAWASQLHVRLIAEVEQAMQDALRDIRDPSPE